MDFRAYGKKAAKKVKSGLSDMGDGDVLDEMDEGNFDVIKDPTTGTAAKQEDVPVDRDDMIESMEADMQHARNRRTKDDDNMGMVDDDLEGLF